MQENHCQSLNSGKELTEVELLAGRVFVSEKPVIGLSYDFKDYGKTQDGKLILAYSKERHDEAVRAIQTSGGVPLVLSYNDEVEKILPFLDGLVICGGRDINPAFYHEELNGSILPPNDIRYKFNKMIMETIPEELPVLGICWGMQFLDVLDGGSLVQDIPDKKQHDNTLRMITFDSTSWCNKVMLGHSVERCRHHQVVNKVGKDYRIVAWDDFGKEPHAMESVKPGWFRIGVQFHPEGIQNDDKPEQIEKNKRFFQAFVDVTKNYKLARGAL